MMRLTVKPCAYCNTPSTETHRLKRCGKCKDVNYCNETCQKADWQAHKSVCDQASDIIATLKEVLLEDGGQLKLVKRTLPKGSFLHKKMPPTRELPLGYEDLTVFPPEWLASIAHLPKEEQSKDKAEFATKKYEAEQAEMTAEGREAERRKAKVVGQIQQKVNTRLAAEDAAKNAPKGSESK